MHLCLHESDTQQMIDCSVDQCKFLYPQIDTRLPTEVSTEMRLILIAIMIVHKKHIK